MGNTRKFLQSLQRTVFPRVRILEQELDASRAAQAAADAELVRVREDLQFTRERDAQQIAGLRNQVQAAESERSAARRRVEHLENVLAEAEQKRIATAERVSVLETRLEEEFTRHEASTQAAEKGLVHLQKGQQSLLARQTELADTIQHAAAGLVDALQAAHGKPQVSTLHLLLVTAVLFVTGIIFGAYTIYNLQDGGPQLAVMEQNVLEMRADIKRHLDNQDELLRGLATALNRLAFGEEVSLSAQDPHSGKQKTVTGKPPSETGNIQPDIRELQADLITLGFDVGRPQPGGELDDGTRQVLQEFRRLYLPGDEAGEGLPGPVLTDLVRKSAALARADATQYPASSEVLGAIRLASIRTGVDYSILMDLARVESSYNPKARARHSSAVGLFQFKDESWLEAVRRYGGRFGLQGYAAGIRRLEAAGKEPADGHDRLREEVLALRDDPRLSSLLVAENIKHNLRKLAGRTHREPGRTELYLSHFLGLSGAARFLEALDAKPAAIAGDIFPEAAARNRSVFRNRKSEPRTVAEVYRWLDGRFNSASDGKRDPG